jgi:hypothetical protein
MERHVIVWHDPIWVGEPFLQRLIRPFDFGFFESFGILKRPDRPRGAAVDTSQARAFLVAVNGVAPAAAFIEQFLAGRRGLRQSGQARKRSTPILMISRIFT